MVQPGRVEFGKRKPLPQLRVKDRQTILVYAAAMRWLERMGNDYPIYPKQPRDFREAWIKVKDEFGVDDAALKPAVEVIKTSALDLAKHFDSSIPFILGRN